MQTAHETWVYVVQASVSSLLRWATGR